MSFRPQAKVSEPSEGTRSTLTIEEWWGARRSVERSSEEAIGLELFGVRENGPRTIPMESLILAQDKRWRRA